MLYQKGKILFGRYYVERLLGSGTFGDVYLARHMHLHVYRAIKCISRQKDAYQTALREADILKNLRHPAIPIVYDIEENEECIGIIEEFVQGLSLKSFLSSKNKIPYQDVVCYADALCEVVEYLHAQGVCHHDIKPENILIDHKQVRLLDYGSAVTMDEKTDACNIVHMGTRGFAAPEMYGKKWTGTSADLYSIGVVMLYMATGRTDAAAVNAVTQKALQAVILKCLHHAKGERFRSLKSLRKALKDLAHRQFVSEVSRTIHFAGIVSHCGTTHCAAAAAKELVKQKQRVVLQEKNDSRDFLQIIRAAARICFRDGVFFADGLDYIPQYDGYVEEGVLSEYDCIIRDFGVITQDNLEEILSGDVVCIVSTGAPYDLIKLNRLLHSEKIPYRVQTKELRILLNFTDGAGYKQIIRQYDLKNTMRVPYAP